MGSEPGAVDEALVDQHRRHGGDEPGIAAGPHSEVVVGHRRGLGDPWIDHDHRPVGIGGDGLERGAGVRDPMGDPRVLAGKERDLAVLEVAAQRRPEHLAHHEHLAGLLLRDRVRLEPNTECGQGRRPIGAAEMVALPAAAVVDDRLASMGVANRRQPLGDLANGGVPVDLLEGSVVSSTKRAQQPLTAPVLVVVEAQRLLAGVALRRRVGLVAADPFEGPSVTSQADLDPAVAFAQDAGGLTPVSRLHHLGSVGHRSSSRRSCAVRGTVGAGWRASAGAR